MIIGIVGSEAAKFTEATENCAKALIVELLTRPGVTGYSSGHCHLGGIDIWTEEIGDALELTSLIYPPKSRYWEWYKVRNIQIAKASTEVHCITLRELPSSYHGMKFKLCYHCGTDSHVKSGGCWTAKYAQRIGKPAYWHVIGDGPI